MRHGTPRALGRVALLVAGIGLLAPEPALAHGLTGRADLPIPIWLFSWGAAAVLVLSFAALGALWSQPRLEGDDFRPLSPGIGRVLTSRALEVVCGSVGVVLLFAVVAAGLGGAQVTSQNIAPTFVYVVFWLGFVPFSVVFGDVFAAFNPWRAVGRVVGRMLARLDAEPLPYPAWLGRWPAAIGLMAFAALELVSPYGDRPATVAYAALVYSSVTWVAMALFGVETWTRPGRGLLGLLQPLLTSLGIRGARTNARNATAAQRPRASRGHARNGRGGDGDDRSVTFDGLSAGPTWLSKTSPLINDVADLGLGPRHAVELVYGAGLLVTVLIIAGLLPAGDPGRPHRRPAPFRTRAGRELRAVTASRSPWPTPRRTTSACCCSRARW